MTNLIFKYQTIISETYIDIICARRRYQTTIVNVKGDTVDNPQNKYEFLTDLFTKLIDDNVVHREFLDIAEATVKTQSNADIEASSNRIYAKIAEVRTVEIEITG